MADGRGAPTVRWIGPSSLPGQRDKALLRTFCDRNWNPLLDAVTQRDGLEVAFATPQSERVTNAKPIGDSLDVALRVGVGIGVAAGDELAECVAHRVAICECLAASGERLGDAECGVDSERHVNAERGGDSEQLCRTERLGQLDRVSNADRLLDGHTERHALAEPRDVFCECVSYRQHSLDADAERHVQRGAGQRVGDARPAQ